MRRSLLASTALTTSTLVAGAACAADLPVKALRPVVIAPFSWTGCYVGGNAGWASTSVGQSAVVPPSALGNKPTAYDLTGTQRGFTGGAQVGCNLQFARNWVVGFETDINSLKASRDVFYGGEDTIRGAQTSSLRYLGTARMRFGYAWYRLFLYGTVGLAYGRVETSVFGRDPPSIYAGSFSSTRTGATGGVGAEYAVTDRLSAKVEYLHFDLGTATSLVGTVFSPVPPVAWPANARVSGDVVRAGINWKFLP
jgi:outer membrane immunogenic protein